MEDIVLFGTSGQAKVVAAIVEEEARYRIVGLFGRSAAAGSDLAYPLIGGDEALAGFLERRPVHGGLVAIGDNWTRAAVVRKIRRIAPEFRFVSAIHPAAHLASGVAVGRGVMVMAGAVVNSGSRVGDFCLVNTHASLDHDSVMEEYSSLGPHAATGGNVHLGAYSYLALGAHVIHGTVIGAHTVIGAGSTVLADLPDHCVAYGTPARVARPRSEGEPYL